MKYKHREPSVGLDVGSMLSDKISDAIRNTFGVREVARLTGLSPAAVSLWAAGKSMLPWSTAMRIADAVGHADEMWTATIYDRVSSCERLGFDFYDRANDAQERQRREREVAERGEA